MIEQAMQDPPYFASAQMHSFICPHRRMCPHALHTHVHTKMISNTGNRQNKTQGEAIVVSKWLLASFIHLCLERHVEVMGQTYSRKRFQTEAIRVHGSLQSDT